MTERDDGYCVCDHVFARSEMASVIDAVSDLRRTRAGARHALRMPAVRELAADPRMSRIAERFIGPQAVAFRATLFDKSPAANWLVVWHQDTALPLRERIGDAEWGPWSTKEDVLHAHAPAWALEQVVALRVSLDDSTHMNGPLRVLPRTHCDGVLESADIERLVGITPAIDCLAESGGVIAMRPLTIHASSKSGDETRRRVLHIEYATRLDLAPGVELAVD